MVEKIDNQGAVKMPIMKRIFDICLSFILVLFSFPLWSLIIILLSLEQMVRLNFPRPIYSEKRISLGKPFNFYKFNIFNPRAINKLHKKGEHVFTKKLEHAKNGTTWFGHIVQMLYLDELPQLFCVFLGRMSMVGPRPRDLVQYKRGLMQGNKVLKMIKAGLAGTYQAHKGEVGANQYDLDMKYIDYMRTHNSRQIIMNDIKIIIKTIKIMLKAQGY